jgi:hypothetical protein
MSTGAVFFAHQKPSTERNSHLAGEASGSSISNGCHAKTKRRRQLAGVATGRGGTKLHASVAGSRVIAFLATAAPWEPYFTDNPRISEPCLEGTGNGGMDALLLSAQYRRESSANSLGAVHRGGVKSASVDNVEKCKFLAFACNRALTAPLSSS